MACDPVLQRCALAALAAGRAIRDAVHAMPPPVRSRPAPAALKPGASLVLAVDAAAEAIALAHLDQLSRELAVPIAVVTDAAGGATVTVGGAAGDERIYAMIDAVDGTIKVGGLGNAPDGSAIRAANDGGWGVGIACTAPTRAALGALTLGDFALGVVVDGNPPRVRTHPAEVVALPVDGAPAAFDLSDAPAVRAALRRAPRVFTSTQTALAESVVYLDGFQAFDRRTRQPGDEALIGALYRRLIDRHRGGAFDVWRQYGNLSALIRLLLGWRGARPWLEAQGGAFVVVNENLANLLPALPVIAGAGGCAVDFSGRPLAARRLADGRTSIVLAANEALRDRVLELVAAAAGAT
jgi:hypothetical protein